MRQQWMARTMDAETDELTRLRRELGGVVPAEMLERLVQAALRAGARRLLQALEDEGRIEPCGQGCGWEGPWAIDSVLWPAERERLLGEGYVTRTQAGDADERRRLLGF